MSEELVAYQVYRTAEQVPTAESAEIDLPAVPLGQTWRIEQMSVVAYYVAGDIPSAGPVVAIYDAANPVAGTAPIQISALSPLYPQQALSPFFGITYVDVDDGGTPITIPGGGQLAIVMAAQAPYTFGVRVQYAVFAGGASSKPQPAAALVPGPNIPPGL